MKNEVQHSHHRNPLDKTILGELQSAQYTELVEVFKRVAEQHDVTSHQFFSAIGFLAKRNHVQVGILRTSDAWAVRITEQGIEYQQLLQGEHRQAQLRAPIY